MIDYHPIVPTHLCTQRALLENVWGSVNIDNYTEVKGQPRIHSVQMSMLTWLVPWPVPILYRSDPRDFTGNRKSVYLIRT